MPSLAAVIFDMNGVIADDEPVHHRLFARVLAGRGFELSWEEYEARYLALDDAGVFSTFCARAGRPVSPAELSRMIEDKAGLYAQELDHVRLFPGTLDLLRRAAAACPVAVCSGALRREVDAILAKAGVAHLVTATVAAEEVSHNKPDPEPYLLAVSRLSEATSRSVQPAGCVAMEDSPPGIAAARTAGLKVIGLTSSYSADRLLTAGAHRAVDDAGKISLEDLRTLAGT